MLCLGLNLHKGTLVILSFVGTPVNMEVLDQLLFGLLPYPLIRSSFSSSLLVATTMMSTIG